MIDSKLLDKIAEYMEISCLSDLRIAPLSELIIAINKINIKQYSLKQWNYSLSYILDTDIHIDTIDDIKIVLEKFK